jgi:hypothetical protein
MVWLTLIVVLVAFAGITLWLIARRGPNLAHEFERRRSVALAQCASQPQPVLTEAQITSLPAPVQRYVRASGSIGKPRVASVRMVLDAELSQKPGQPGPPGTAEQFDSFADPPKRLFFMRTRMFGLPVAVLHVYDGAFASMKVRVASIFNVVNLHSQELARTETVTLLNDLCFFAPSWLADPRLVWRDVDAQHAEVTFTNGPHQVSATLVFDEAGELVNFISDDRGALQNDGKLKRFRWSTPMRGYREFDGRRLPTAGIAIWHYPEGDFVYGRFALKSLA